MVSNITDNYFIDIHISPQNGHYHTFLFPLFLPIYLQHMRCDDNGISLLPTPATLSLLIRYGKINTLTNHQLLLTHSILQIQN